MSQDISAKLAAKDIHGRGLSKEDFTTKLKLSAAKNIKIVGKKAGFLGDSITNGSSAGAGRDWTRQLKRQLGSAVISDVTSIQAGVPGNNSSQVLARYNTDIRANGVEVLFCLCGTNDIIQGLPLSNYAANIKAIHQKTIEDGIPVIFGTVPPLGTAEQTVSRKENIVKYNSWLKLYCSICNIPLADIYTRLVVLSGASAGIAIAGWYNADGVHPNTYGHEYIAEAFAEAFNGIFSAPHLVDHINSFNLVANPTFIVDGSSWLEQSGGTGSSAAYSTVTDTTGKLKYGKWYQADWDATTGGSKHVRCASINLTSAGIIAGDKLLITARCDYEDIEGNYLFNATVDNPPCSLSLFVMDQGFAQKDVLDGGAVAKPGPVARIFTVPDGMTGLIVSMNIKLNTGRRVKFKIGEVGVFKVTDLTDIINYI